ncbi:MAG: sensor histidine kinase [Anaerolineales bacterium]|nr:sensor histidine kinase [Anaerolineales bacterium]
MNLIDNGIKYGKPGGTVRVELRQQTAGLQITVADDGPGIPSDDLPHLFKELFRGQQSRHTGGSGLGLAIVRRIVEQHGGQISCASEPGRGTAFHITLPVENQ